MITSSVCFLIAFGLASVPAVATPQTSKAGGKKANFSVDGMLEMLRLSDPDVSADGSLAVFTVKEIDLEANRGRTDLFLTGTSGGAHRRLTSHPDADSDGRFVGDFVYFISGRSGSAQVHRIQIAGGEAEPVTKLPVGINGFRVFPDGQRILLWIDVYPNAATLEDTKKKDEEREKQADTGRAYEGLLFRHWDSWEDGKRSHLFVFDPRSGAPPIDLTRGLDADTPTHPFGGGEELAISPDGNMVAFSVRPIGNEAAYTTNVDLFLVATDGKSQPQNLTRENAATDAVPAFSPDGKTLAYLAMARPQYESDRTRIVLFDLKSKTRRTLTENWDRSPGSITWSSDQKTIYTTADDLGNHALFAIDVSSGIVRTLVKKGHNTDPRPTKDRIVFMRDDFSSPAELYSVGLDGGTPVAITKLNQARLGGYAFSAPEQFSFPGAKGDTVYGYVFRPPGHTQGTVPVALLVHGGPQGSFLDRFHYRWNPQIYAGHGYGVVMIDFHGSTGYGQAFTDAIRGDWGGAPYEDLMLGLDFALKKYPWLDGKRTAALGASYGGYLINWINGKTDRFKALVCHDGNIDERMAYYETEELWFPEWERGLPWEKPEAFLHHSPIELVKNWKTPTLVIHGANDFRVVDTQGLATFTALQRRGVPSRLLHFPDENHWVLRPQNSRRWHQEVLGWLDRFIKK